MGVAWVMDEVPLAVEVPTAPTLRLLATLRQRQLAAGLVEWLAGRGELRRLAVTEHRPGMTRLVDRVGVPEEAATGGTRGWPLGGDGPRWPVIERSLVHWLHGSSPAGWRVAHAHEGDEVCVLVAGEPAAVYAVHASREPGLGGFADDELRSWAKAAVLLRQVVCQRAHSRPATTMAERVEHAAAKLSAKATRLSVREQQVVARIACGMTSDGIAADLGVAPSTVLTLRRRAYAKLDINSRVELCWLAQ